MKIFKNNQVVIIATALMLITAGYLNFTNAKSTTVSTEDDSIGDATLVSSSAIVPNEAIINNENTIEEIADTSNSKDEKEQVKDSKDDVSEYFAELKLERDNMYSQIVESYQKILQQEAVGAEQKAIAQNEITKINNTKNAIMITENLIKAKGFKNIVILVNDESISAIIPNENLKQEEVAQIQNIISREMKAEVENIHISNK